MSQSSRALALSSLPLYNNGDITKLSLMADVRVTNAEMPAVNRLSATLKALASNLADAFRTEGLELVQAGIGDCTAGYTYEEIVLALNYLAAAEGEIFLDPIVIEASLKKHLHLMYGDVRGVQQLISGTKSFLDRLLGFEVRDYLTITHGGRSAVFIALRAALDAMKRILAEMCLEAIRPLRNSESHVLMDEVARFTASRDDAEIAVILIERSWTQAADDEQIVRILLRYVSPLIAVPTPAWGTYYNICEQAIGRNSMVALKANKDGLVDTNELDALCQANPRIRMLLYCNPVNPSGRVASSDGMAEQCRVVHRHHLFVYEDAMYAMFAWKHAHRSMLRAAGLLAHSGDEGLEVGKWVAAHTFLLTGVMKAGGSGSRVNFMIIPNSQLRSRYVATQGDLYGPPNIFAQFLQLVFIQNGGPQRVWLQMNERRLKLQQALDKVSNQVREYGIHLTWSEMEGGFYTACSFAGVAHKSWVNHAGVRETINSGEAFGRFLVEKAALVGSPDESALILDIEFMRLAYGTMSDHEIELLERQLPAALIALAKDNGYVAI